MLLYQVEQREAIVEKYLDCVGKLKEDENYFKKVCVYRILLALIPGMGSTSFMWEFLSTVFRKKRGVQHGLLESAVFQVPLAQNNPSAKVAYLGGTYSTVLHSLQYKLDAKALGVSESELKSFPRQNRFGNTDRERKHRISKC